MTDPAGVHAALERLGATVAAAESLTGGLLSAALTRTPGSSRTFRGGLVVYATYSKHTLAAVPSALLETDGPVSPSVAAALAEGARDRLGATFGVSLTGVAGPGEQDGVPAGTVYAAVAAPDRTEVRRLALPGGREEVRQAAVSAALDLLAGLLAECQPCGER
jgi:nicotinamide-nucleotide amidase